MYLQEQEVKLLLIYSIRSFVAVPNDEQRTTAFTGLFYLRLYLFARRKFVS